MKKIIIIISLFVFSCTGFDSTAVQIAEQENDDHKHRVVTQVAPVDTRPGIPLNNGQKWKVDEPTRKNVAALIKTINDSNLLGSKNKIQLSAQLKTDLDTLVRQCRMKGADHEALHTWLQQVMQGVKAVKKADEKEYHASYAVLKMNLESFYDSFE